MTCSCPVTGDADDPGRHVWRGSGALPTLPEIARRVAPVLWFSGDDTHGHRHRHSSEAR